MTTQNYVTKGENPGRAAIAKHVRDFLAKGGKIKIYNKYGELVGIRSQLPRYDIQSHIMTGGAM